MCVTNISATMMAKMATQSEWNSAVCDFSTLKIYVRGGDRAYEQEALAAVEQNAEDVVATPLAPQQRGEEHAPPLADHEETRWEGARERTR